MFSDKIKQFIASGKFTLLVSAVLLTLLIVSSLAAFEPMLAVIPIAGGVGG